MNINTKKLNKNMKTPSLRDIMFGKKNVKSLPDNFFEKVLDCELRIRTEFNINVYQQLIELYSSAIEYYEINEDPKFKDYKNKLNHLLSQPEFIKKINDGSKSSKFYSL